MIKTLYSIVLLTVVCLALMFTLSPARLNAGQLATPPILMPLPLLTSMMLRSPVLTNWNLLCCCSHRVANIIAFATAAEFMKIACTNVVDRTTPTTADANAGLTIANRNALTGVTGNIGIKGVRSGNASGAFLVSRTKQ